MTHARSCPQTEQAVGWVLHALEPEEEMAVQQHIPGCAECSAAVRDTEIVLTQFATSVEQVEPPAGLRDSIMSAAAAEPRSPAAGPERTRQQAAGPVPRRRPVPSAPPPGPGGPSRPARGGAGRRRLVTVAAALVALIAVGGLGVRAAQLQGERDVAAARAQNLTTLVQQLANPHALLAKDDGSVVGAVVLAEGQRQVYTVALPANASDQEYVLWGVKGGAVQALGAFDVASGDQGMRPVGSAGQDAYEAYAVSLEAGRTLPTTPSAVLAKGALVT